MFTAPETYSQMQDSTTVPPGNMLLTGFNQQINTVTWNGIAGGLWTTNDYSVSFNENFNSVLIQGVQKLIRDDQNFSGAIKRRILGNLSGFSSFSSNFVNDNRQIGLNLVGASTILGGLSFVNGTDSLLGGIGNRWDQQAGVENNGFTYDLQGAATLTPFTGAQILPSISLHDEQIFPRRSYDKDVNLMYAQIFSPRSSIAFTGSYGLQLRDFYFPADSTVQSLYNVKNNIQDRNVDMNSFSANISMPVSFFQLDAQSSFGQRQISFTNRYKPVNDPTGNLYDTRIKISNFSLTGQLSTGIMDDSLLVRMEHTERTEMHAIINASALDPFTQQQMSNQAQLNNIGIRNTLSTQLFLHLGQVSATVTGLASIFHYDTPSILNYDDRDELTNTLALFVNNQFTPFFQAGFGMEADLIHIVYIMSQRSANNNKNFIYKFYPVVSYSDERINSFNRFEVLANYTVYDFEAFSQIHSFSFRQASFLDSTTVRVTSKLSVHVLVNLKLYTRGELYWATFSEYPLNYFVDETYWPSLNYSTGSLSYGVGYKYLSLIQYNYVTARVKEFSVSQTNAGPTAFMSIRMSHLALRLDGWYQMSKQSLQNQIVYPNFVLTARYII
ncbi:MAG: hypothetical protein M1469_12230 [Bacteroidetes bacterium]|nr:hypothetical protein [Bacteroidota bacterium]